MGGRKPLEKRHKEKRAAMNKIETYPTVLLSTTTYIPTAFYAQKNKHDII